MSGLERPVDGHPGDLLSALLDGELDASTATSVRRHVAACATCAAELDDVAAARRSVRAAPAVEPPPGFLAALLADADADAGEERGGPATVSPLRPRGRPPALAGLAASVAAALVVLGVGLVEPGPVAPQVTGAVDAHLSTVSALWGDAAAGAPFLSQASAAPVTPSTHPEHPPEGAPAPFVGAERLAGGYRLAKSFRSPDGLHLVYSSGAHTLSVFEWAGRCDFEALPEGGRFLDVGGWPGWQLVQPPVDGRVVVVEKGELVALVVGDESGEAVLEAAASLPGSRPLSTVQRLRRAAASSLEHLSPAG